MSDVVFVECNFEGCDLSNAKLKGTAFKTVRFRECKLLGLHFDDCNPFLLALSFEDCVLNFAVFYQVKLKKTNFVNCKLEEADFMEADLTNAVFLRCELQKAVFENTNLEGADFRTAFNFSIDPTTNRVQKARFSGQNIAGLLHRFGVKIE